MADFGASVFDDVWVGFLCGWLGGVPRYTSEISLADLTGFFTGSMVLLSRGTRLFATSVY